MHCAISNRAPRYGAYDGKRFRARRPYLPSIGTRCSARNRPRFLSPERRPALAEIDEAVVAASHQDWLQLPVASQSVLSSLATHVVQASS